MKKNIEACNTNKKLKGLEEELQERFGTLPASIVEQVDTLEETGFHIENIRQPIPADSPSKR
ncbi:MAG TPA: hypothetical protein PK370_01265 [Candidatus Woesebacteria bacterium]|nr:hypothetical protein [Candidatus Woesebacteria bacterium]HPJ17222.1 hypothetical protein [Candidatus Woesebacteria bacterium]